MSADELDRNRIRQRFALRRALYRSRSYAIIAAVVCAVAVGQLGQSALHAIRGRSFGWAGLYVVVMIVGAFAAIHFYRHAVALHKEASRPMFDESPTTPDFSTLSNGSQVHERLHDVR